jgi:hypothetical protein
VTPGAAGEGFTVTVIGSLGPSQLPAVVWLTYHVLVPGELVEGVGAMELPVPPVADVYHNKLVPLAVSGLAACPWQYVTGVVAGGEEGASMVSCFDLVSLPQAALDAVNVIV